MTETDFGAGMLAIGFISGVFLGFFAGSAVVENTFRIDATQRGYASYCPTNGEWAWRGECRK